MSTNNKVQRWVDLLAALLQHTPLTFDEIARVVPAYSTRKKGKDSVKRMFERDKKDLILSGVPIETIGERGNAEAAYRVSTLSFYLPYLAAVTSRGRSAARRVDRYGYRLPELTFDAEELRAIAEGAARAGNLGSPPLEEDVDSAMRKLSYDLPIDSVAAPADVRILQPKARENGKTLLVLGQALHERRRVRFDYHALGTEAPSARIAEPYGLFFLNAHWYLVARDVEKDAVRHYRVSRIQNVKLVSADKERPDYEIPSTFQLREHARSRQSWELGDADAVDVVVECHGTLSPELGERDERGDGFRRFRVRRMDAFVRWLLSFAGDATPVSPPSVVDEFRRQVVAVHALYANDAAPDTEEASE